MIEYSEMRNFLIKAGKTHEEMQDMWDYCAYNGHPLISKITECGKNWTDLNPACILSLEKEYLKLKENEEVQE